MSVNQKLTYEDVTPAFCVGVYANAPYLETCRNELHAVLEDWILFRIYKNLTLPTIDGFELAVKKVA